MLPAGAAAVHPLSLLCPRWKIRRTDFAKKEGPLHGIGSVRVAPALHRLWDAVFPLQTRRKGSPHTGSKNLFSPQHRDGKSPRGIGRKAAPRYRIGAHHHGTSSSLGCSLSVANGTERFSAHRVRKSPPQHRGGKALFGIGQESRSAPFDALFHTKKEGWHKASPLFGNS